MRSNAWWNGTGNTCGCNWCLNLRSCKIPQLAKTFGKAKSEYRKGEIEGDNELKDIEEKKNNETS